MVTIGGRQQSAFGNESRRQLVERETLYFDEKKLQRLM